MAANGGVRSVSGGRGDDSGRSRGREQQLIHLPKRSDLASSGPGSAVNHGIDILLERVHSWLVLEVTEYIDQARRAKG